MGRRARDEATKRLEGDKPSRLRIAWKAPGGPSGDAGRPQMPTDLGEHGKAAWGRLAALLDAEGGLTGDAGELLAIYGRAADRHAMARAALLERGLLLTTPQGGIVANPAATTAKAAEGVMLRTLTELGLTPATRGKAGRSAPAPEDDDMQAFFARRRERFADDDG